MATIINEPAHTFNEYLLIPGYSSSQCVPENVSLRTPLVKYRRGENLRASVNISFEEAAFGCKKEVTVGRVEKEILPRSVMRCAPKEKGDLPWQASSPSPPVPLTNIC